MTMSISTELLKRSEGNCELCLNQSDLDGYTVPPKNSDNAKDQVALCSICLSQIANPNSMDSNHFRCLSNSMWTQEPAVQVMVYRILNKLNSENWAQNLFDQLYLDDDTMEWAQAGNNQSEIVHKDSNGHVLANGDSVVLIQDLNVKGANFTAKRGTAVRRIRLVPDNAEHIEGKVDGQQIVILTKYVKKS